MIEIPTPNTITLEGKFLECCHVHVSDKPSGETRVIDRFKDQEPDDRV